MEWNKTLLSFTSDVFSAQLLKSAIESKLTRENNFASESGWAPAHWLKCYLTFNMPLDIDLYL